MGNRLVIASAIIFAFPFKTVAQIPPFHVNLGNWMAIHGSAGHNGFSALKGDISSWNVKYSVYAGQGESQPAVGDVNGDGTPDIVFVQWNCTVKSFNGATGTLQWSRSFGGIHSSAPSIGDVRADIPGMEIAVSCGSSLHLLRGTDGSVIWSRSGRGGTPGAVIAADGPDTLIVSSNGTTVYATDPYGNLVWSGTAGGTNYHSATPAVGDITGDGRPEVIVRGSNGYVYAYDFSSGSLLWSRYLGSTSIWSGVSLGDVTGDCVDEVIVGINGTLYVLNGSDGTTLWSYTTGGYIAGPISVADVNGDSLRDIILGVRNSPSLCVSGRGVIAVSGTGSLLWQNLGWTPNAMHGGGRVIADFDNDGTLEVAGVPYGSWCSGDATFRMINATTGTTEWTYSFSVDAEGASMADVDGDMCAELMLLPSCCDNMNIIVLDGPGSDCGFYPYNDTCGILVGEGDLSVEERQGSGYDVEVVGGRGYVDIIAPEAVPVKVYGIDGRAVFEGTVKGRKRLSLTRGAYFVMAGRRNVRVVVR